MRSYVVPAEYASTITAILKTEMGAHDYYRVLAAKAPNKDFEYIFTMLANEEKKHFYMICEMRRKEPVETPRPDPTVVAALDIFDQLYADPGVDLLGAKDEVELYERVHELEGRKRDVYLQRAQSATDPDVKKLFAIAALEGQKHCNLLAELVCMAKEGAQCSEALDKAKTYDAVYDLYSL
jgi:rubrerythrin